MLFTFPTAHQSKPSSLQHCNRATNGQLTRAGTEEGAVERNINFYKSMHTHTHTLSGWAEKDPEFISLYAEDWIFFSQHCISQNSLPYLCCLSPARFNWGCPLSAQCTDRNSAMQRKVCLLKNLLSCQPLAFLLCDQHLHMVAVIIPDKNSNCLHARAGQ